jgi:enoyl-CoA hydratase
MTDTIDDVLIRREGRAGRITLNRPKALNALTLGMVRRILPALQDWAADREIAHVVLDGTGDRALCAGGDVVSLYNARVDGSHEARTFWREEYALNALIHRYPKAFVPIMHGIVMGGGIGLSAHAQGGTRVVTEKSRLAFPETTIGLIPDVGGTWLLSRAPDHTGAYYALMGAPMGAADALHTGFADDFVPSAAIPDLIAGLSAGTAPAREVIAKFAANAGPSTLTTDLKAPLAACFGFDSVEEIRDALMRDGGAWAQKILADLAVRSPTALKTTLAAIHRARGYTSLEQALNVEFVLCTNLYEDGEFIEGVRALLVDKDKAPRWSPPTIEAVSQARVERQFAALADGDAVNLAAPRTIR